MAELRSEGLIVLAMATSGSGSTLLKGGGTVHGKCKVSIDLTETSMCSYPDNSPMIQLIKEVSLMIIDEATLGDMVQGTGSLLLQSDWAGGRAPDKSVKQVLVRGCCGWTHSLSLSLSLSAHFKAR